MKVEDSKIRIRKKNSSSVLEVKNDSSANDGTKVITVQKKLFSFIFLLQKELGYIIPLSTQCAYQINLMAF